MRKTGVSLGVEGTDIVGELCVPKGDGRATFPSLCICHGIPSGRSPDPKDGGYPLLAERFCAAGFATMIFNFRGCGLSGGNLDLWGWTRDLDAVLEYLATLPEIDPARICLMGFSGGAAVSAYVASHSPRVTLVILCACPAEFRFVATEEEALPFIDQLRRTGAIRDKGFPSSVAEWLEGFRRVSPIQWIDRISPRPLLIIHGQEDELVEMGHAWELFRRAREPKEIAIVEGGKHKLRLNQKAMDIALEWLKRQI